jgi:hypothetical protein
MIDGLAAIRVQSGKLPKPVGKRRVEKCDARKIFSYSIGLFVLSSVD